jgi:iron complex outermembrane receptor protein
MGTAATLPCTYAADESTQLPDIIVTANHAPERVQDVAASVTGIPSSEIERAGLGSVRDASALAPNINVVEFTARAVSNPQFRGVGGSPTNPGVTTYIDGVPQLSGDTSSIEFLDLERIEFVRGAQGTLYGRNTLGGVINLISREPSKQWSAFGEQTVGDFAQRDFRGGVSGSLTNDWAGSLAAGYSTRDGYTINDATGHDLDRRDAKLGKAQLAYRPNDQLQIRLIGYLEDSNDGDFALGDLAQLRANPYHVNHNFEGFTQRRINGQTLHIDYRSAAFNFESITGRVGYSALETTDLDANATDQLTRRNHRIGDQLTQEFRFSSPQALSLWGDLHLNWQAGLFGFRQGNDQQVTNFIPVDYLVQSANTFFSLPANVPPAALAALAQAAATLNADPAQDRTTASLNDRGLGGFAEGRFDLDQWSLTLGLRYDYEHKQADILSGTSLTLAGLEIPVSGPTSVNSHRTFNDVSPRAILAYAPDDSLKLYFSAAKGYRAGGFNPQSPAGKESYDEEHSVNLELGAKGRWFDGRLAANLSVFDIQLDDLQLNVPIPGGAGRFYIDNTGKATSRGAELELTAKPLAELTLFSTLGILDARFGNGSQAMGSDVSGKRLPFGDRLTLLTGAQYYWRLSDAISLGLRAEYQRAGDYFYEAQNQEGQDAYGLLNLRAGLSGAHWRIEAGVRNALDQDTIPLAIPYTGIAPSGYVGESGAPRTFAFLIGFDL